MVEDSDIIARRRAHAEQELAARGVLKSGRFPPGLRMILRLFPKQKAPYYGDYLAYGVQMGTLFGLPFVVLLAWVFALDEALPAWPGALIGIAAGVFFGAIMALWMRSVARRLQLTPWEALDDPPGPAPEGAENYTEIEAELIAKRSAAAMLSHVAKAPRK